MNAMTSFLLAAQPTENENPLLPDLGEIVVGTVVFFVVLIVLGKILLPRIQKTLEERTEAIEGGIKRAEEAQREVEELKKQYQEQLAQARHDAAQEREKAREEGAKIIAELRQQGEAEKQRLVDQARTQIEADRQQASNTLRAEIGSLSTQLASRIVGESLEDEVRQRGIVDRFLSDLESGSVGNGAAKEQV